MKDYLRPAVSFALALSISSLPFTMPVEAFAGNRGNRVSRNANNRQGNRQSVRSNRQTNRFPNREEAINNRTERLNDRQDGRNHRVDSRQDGINHRVDERNKTARKYADKYWNGNGYHWSGGYYGGWYGPRYYNNWGWYNNSWGAFVGGAVLGALLTTALTNNTQYVVVPNTSYELYYDTIRTSGNIAYFTVDGRQTSVDCKAGTLNFKTPEAAAEAELVNAACIYAFGG